MKLPRSISHLTPLVAALTLIPVAAYALGLSGAGGRLGVLDPEGGDGTAALGAHLEFTQASPWMLTPSILYWDEGGLSDLSFNADMSYQFRTAGTTTPYLGAGLGLNRFDSSGSSSSTELGVNLFGGLRFPAGSSTLFVEGRYTASDVSQTSLLGGVTFYVPR